jgi:hypothetical protein
MKRGKFVLFVSFIMACSAHAADASRRAKPSADANSAFRGKCETDRDGTKFAAKVCYLNESFNAINIPYGRDYQQPTCNRLIEISAGQKEILARAYRLAPNYAQGKLCRLTQLFLTKDPKDPIKGSAPWGWGLWEAPDRPPGKSVFIAISDRYLAEVKSFGATETDVLARLLSIPSPIDEKIAPRFGAADDPALTALGVLAHELGHVLLAVTNADGTDARHPRRKVRGAPISACFDKAFLAQSWDARRFRQSMDRWVDFGEQKSNRQKNIRFNVTDLRGKADAANEAIKSVYRSREFVSAIAALRPEEDFVETYKYKLLADVKQPPTIGILGQARNVSLRNFLAAPVIKRKIECLRTLGVFAVQK